MMEKNFLQHLQDLRKCVMNILLSVGIFSIFSFTFGLRYGTLWGINLWYIWPDITNNIVSLLFNRIRIDLLPEDMKLIPIGMGDAVIVQLKLAIIFGIAMSMPVIVYQLGKFISSALHKHEKALIIKLTVPSMILFISGCLFSYYYILPYIVDFLLRYIYAMGVEPMVSIDSFLSFVLIFIVSFGIVFEIPVIMGGLTSLGIVGTTTWKEYWRLAFVGFIIFGAIITPDGSGITQLLIALPMMLLYIIGYAVSYMIARRRKRVF